MRIIGDKVYKWCVTGDWLLAGRVVRGLDCYYIEWYN